MSTSNSTSDVPILLTLICSPSSKSSYKNPVRVMTTQVTLGEDVIKVCLSLWCCDAITDILQALTKLGVKMTTRPSECTHLLAAQLVRTEKFLCALSGSPFILTDKWATASAAAKKLLRKYSYYPTVCHLRVNLQRRRTSFFETRLGRRSITSIWPSLSSGRKSLEESFSRGRRSTLHPESKSTSNSSGMSLPPMVAKFVLLPFPLCFF